MATLANLILGSLSILTSAKSLQAASPRGEMVGGPARETSVVGNLSHPSCKIHYESMEIHVSRFPDHTLMEAETNRATGVRVRVQYFSYEGDNYRFIFRPDYDDSGLGSELNEQGSADRMNMLFNHVNPFDEILPWIAKHVLVRHKVSGEICNLIAELIEANARPGFDDHQSDESWIYFFLLSVKDEIYDLIIEYLA